MQTPRNGRGAGPGGARADGCGRSGSGRAFRREAALGPAARRPASFDLAPLVARLEAGPRIGSGRTLLVVETAATRPALPGPSLVEALETALSAAGRGALGRPERPGSDQDAPGLTDLVAGQAAFLDVIQAANGIGVPPDRTPGSWRPRCCSRSRIRWR